MKKAWKYRIYPSKSQREILDQNLIECKNLWNKLLEYTKEYYKNTGKFPSKADLCKLTKETSLFSQVAQNVADRLVKSIKLMIKKKKSNIKAGFPRFKSIERVKSFTYPQYGFSLDKKLVLSKIGKINIKKHRNLEGKIKTLTIRKTLSGKWYAIFTTENEIKTKMNNERKIRIDLGLEHFAYLSNGKIIENPRHLKEAERELKEAHKNLSKKKKGSKNRNKAKLKVAKYYETLTNKRRDFLHKISRNLVNDYSFIALENLNISGMAKGFLAKSILDCSWAEFIHMINYKAEEAGSKIMLVNPAKTTQKCSNCNLINKKALSERWYKCACGSFMHRDLNAANNILQKATAGTAGSNASKDGTVVLSMKEEANDFSHG